MSALEEARQRFEQAGLPFPPIPPEFTGSIQRLEPWVFGTRTDEANLYYIDVFVDETLRGDAPEYVLLGHSGRGTNSWAIHYFLVRGPLALFVQIGWGGALTSAEDNAAAAGKLARIFADTQRLIEAADEARRSGRLAGGERYLAQVSGFYGSQWARLEPAGPSAAPVAWHAEGDERVIPKLIELLAAG